MSIEGQLQIQLHLASQRVSVRSTRPMLAVQRLLQGKQAAEVLSLMPHLFSVCAIAHTFAAKEVCCQAPTKVSDPAEQAAWSMLLRAELLREHGLYFMRTWAEQCGLTVPISQVRWLIQFPQRVQAALFQAQPVLSVQQVRASAVANFSAIEQEMCDFLQQHIFGETLEAWKTRISGWALQHWLDHTNTVAAQVVRHCGGVEAESALQQLISPYVWQRLHALSRLCGLGSALPIVRVDAQSVVVQAARGRLMHRARLSSAQTIVDYSISSPTDVYFQAGGYGELGLRQLMQTSKPASLEADAKTWIAALDPCVSYQLELCDA